MGSIEEMDETELAKKARMRNMVPIIQPTPSNTYRPIHAASNYNPPNPQEEYRQIRQKLQSDEITLSYLLNLFDGVLETPGRILIITTNHPEKLDAALKRAGRLDLHLHFDKCTSRTTVQIFEHFYNTSCPITLPDKKFTPAEVIQQFFKHMNDSQAGLQALLEEKKEC